MLELAGTLFRWAGGAVVPMLLRPTAPAGLAWFVHALLVAGAAVGLYFAQPYIGVTENIGRGPGWFRPYWLPVLFLLGYALVWSAVWVWRLLAPVAVPTDFPDLDDAWAAAVAALDKAGIGLADTPVFLVFGGHPGGLDPVFRAMPGGPVVAGAPGAGAPLQVYANRDAVYLVLPGASLLGTQDQVDLLAVEPGDTGSLGVDASVGFGQSVGIGQSVGFGHSIGLGSVGFGQSIDFGNTGAGAGNSLREIQKLMARLNAENRPPTEAERQRIRELSGGGGGGPAPAGGSRGPARSVLQNPQLVADAEARLTHVCGLLAAARWPLCPANGAVVAVPAAATDRDDGAQQWGLVARQDLAVAEAALRLRFPVYVLVGGVEDFPGGHTFFDKFALEKGKERLGRGFPLNPDGRPEDVQAAVEAGAAWLFGNLLPYQVYRQMRVEPAGGGADTRDNGELVRFLATLRKRRTHLARLVSRAMVPGPDRVPVYGGCYLSVVLRSDPTEAKFTRAFLQKVAQSQAAVAWTEAAYEAEASYRTRTTLGYAAMSLWLAGVAGFAGYVAYTKWGR